MEMAETDRAVAPLGAGRLRLTRRGRLVVRVGLVLLIGAAVLTSVLVMSGSAEAGSGGGPAPMQYHVVLPGETLWGLAGQIAPDQDRRDTVAQIVELNALDGSGVVVGQRLALPVVE
jgi:LysM repeat protein